ncbi:Purine nucleoside phosphorylase [hydrothermal vent metagenome]|uniref:Purine nucleoside phosphorylase n=1 Tax=hydrothermal vent metagenome TaxID=652676 RepID=A0A1W1E9Y3_9ZZZZ
MIICAGDIEQFDFAKPVGIGLENVAINLTRVCMLEKPSFLFFVGTVGSYGEKEIFEIVEAQKATQIEQSMTIGNAYTPLEDVVQGITSLEDMTDIDFSFFSDQYVSRETRQANDNSLSFVGLKPELSEQSVIVNSSNYITTNETAGVWYRQKGIHLENMEFYAVLKVAQKFGIPAAGAFVVTNYCNKEAHSDFMKHHQEAMDRLTQYIKEKI